MRLISSASCSTLAAGGRINRVNTCRSSDTVGSVFSPRPGVDDEDGVAVAPLVAEFGHAGIVVPGTAADEVLDGPAADASVVGDGLGGLEFQAGEFGPQDDGGVGALLGAEEQGQVAMEERGQALGATPGPGDGRGCLA